LGGEGPPAIEIADERTAMKVNPLLQPVNTFSVNACGLRYEGVKIKWFALAN
jgi:hypothetical protein